MIKIIHIADTHIRNNERHEEYKDIFNKIYNELKIIQPDIVTIVGDLLDNFIEISNEAKNMASDFLNELSKLCNEVVIVHGNHEIRKKNLNRLNSVESIVNIMGNPKVTYFKNSGFFDDKLYDIVWVNHSHSEKNINPWKDITHNKDKSKIYIDLFHDPINDCSTDTGMIFKNTKYKSISDFKGDFVFLGDIHKRQFFRKNKSAAYCGSTVQQDFGEKVEGHGFLLWKITSPKDFEVEEYDIPNEHSFVNLYVDENTDYDQLKFTIKNKTPDVDIKVHWKDLSSNINTSNEKEIRDYIKNNLDTTKVKFEKVFVYNDIVSSKMLSETLDLTDEQTQNEIFKEYLEEQKYSQKDIDEILKLDNLINDRLQLNKNKTNIEWSIDKFWFSNFKSYGDNNVVDWKDLDGIYQIHGINKQGKTTILDALTYILYGTTTTTMTPEKFGDSRYLNNKRDLDYCLGGAVIDVDGEKFVIQRRTDRKWDKKGTKITGVSSTLDYYKSEVIDDKNKITGEVLNKTQKKLDSILGSFKDFVRLSFTNADNLNDTLSENRSVFIDNIIRDAGYDVFETKLEEFKEYKKEQNEEKIVLNIQESEELIKGLEIENEDIKTEIKITVSDIELKEIELNNLNIERDGFNKKLNKIDESMLNFDPSVNQESIFNYDKKIEESSLQIKIIERDIELLPESFDDTKLNELKIELKNTNDKISERKDEVYKVKNLITESENKKEKVLDKIKELRESEIRNLELKISNNEREIEVIKNKKENILNEEISNINSELQKIELKKSEINNDMKLLQKDGVYLKSINDDLDKDIEELKNSKTCPTCGRDFEEGSEHLIHIQDKIDYIKGKKDKNNIEIQRLLTNFKNLKNSLPEFEYQEEKLKSFKEELKQGKFSDEVKDKLKEVGSTKYLKEENIKIQENINEIKNNIYDNVEDLKSKIDKGNELILGFEKDKKNNEQFILNIESELKNFNINGIEDDISIEERKKSNFELRDKKLSQKENFNLQIENYKLRIKELQSEYEKYEEYKIKIEENILTQSFIDEVDTKINNVKNIIKELYQKNNDSEKTIVLKENEIKNITSKIKQYLKQKKREELLKEYQKCISRDGLPTFLLKKSIHLINKELNELLSNVDFTLFFDDNLTLRMSSDDRLDVSQNAIESSGMERTFCALSLKMALRQINVKSKPTFIVLDEIMGKLVEDSIKEFTDFLNELKNKVKKIIIIEHVHPINYDVLIEVKKDENLISSLELLF